MTRWLFAPRSTLPLGAFRAVFGFVVLLWTASLLPDLLDFFGRDGIQPLSSTYISGSWTVLDLWGTDAAVYTVWAVLLAASAALTLGWHSRLASLLVFVGVMSLHSRNIWVFNSGDLLLRSLSFLLVLTPSGTALSLDRRRVARRRGEDLLDAPLRSPWPWRLLQVQMSLVYLFGAWEKLPGETWRDGTAVGYALEIGDMSRFGVPPFVDFPLLVNVATYGALAIEVFLVFGLWTRRTRRWAIAAGLALHVAIDLALTVGFFSHVILSTYLLFVDPDTIARLARQVLRLPPTQPAHVENA